MAIRYLINDVDVEEDQFNDAVGWARERWKDDGSTFDVSAHGLDLTSLPTMQLTAPWLVLLNGCDCDQHGHPERGRHAPDCRALAVSA